MAVAAMTAGACRRIFETTLEYAKDREQYGRPDRLVPGAQAPAGRHVPRGRAGHARSCYFAALTIAEDDPATVPMAAAAGQGGGRRLPAPAGRGRPPAPRRHRVHVGARPPLPAEAGQGRRRAVRQRRRPPGRARPAARAGAARRRREAHASTTRSRRSAPSSVDWLAAEPPDRRGDGGRARARLGPPPGVGAGLDPPHVRRRLARARLAAGAGRPQRRARSRRSCTSRSWPGRRPPHDQPAGPRHRRPVDPRLRHRGADPRLRHADPAGRAHRLPRDERARRGQRPGLAQHAGRSSTATASWSTARRCGPRAPTTPTSASSSAAPIPTAPKHKGISVLLRRRWTRPASPCGRCAEIVHPERARPQRGVLRRRRRAGARTSSAS